MTLTCEAAFGTIVEKRLRATTTKVDRNSFDLISGSGAGPHPKDPVELDPLPSSVEQVS